MKYHGKLSHDDVIDIRQKFDEGVGSAQLARAYGVNINTICDIRKNCAYNHIGNKVAPKYNPLDKATKELELRNRNRLQF